MSYSLLNPKLRVGFTKLGGGIIAHDQIAAGELVAVFGGYVMKASEEVGDWALQVSEGLVIGSPPGANAADDPGKFFNHSCAPNAGIKGQIFLVAMRDIAPEEEVTFDYAMVLHPAPGCPSYRLKCRCGSSCCRGVITDNDWRLPELQARYEGWFSWYLQEKMRSADSRGNG